jgi:hypothetical protein
MILNDVASRCRQKKKVYINELEDRNRLLVVKNEELKRSVGQLQDLVAKLQSNLEKCHSQPLNK